MVQRKESIRAEGRSMQLQSCPPLLPPRQHGMWPHAVPLLLLQMGDRVAAQMQQCKTWWNEQTAERERKRQQQLQEQQEQGTAAK